MILLMFTSPALLPLTALSSFMVSPALGALFAAMHPFGH